MGVHPVGAFLASVRSAKASSAEVRFASACSAEMRPADARSAGALLADAGSADAILADALLSDARSASASPMDVRSAEAYPVGALLASTSSADVRFSESRLSGARAARVAFVRAVPARSGVRTACGCVRARTGREPVSVPFMRGQRSCMRFMVPRRACAAAMPSSLGGCCGIYSGRGLKVPLVPKVPFPPKAPFLSGTSFCRKPLPWKAFSPKRDAPPSSTRRRLRALLRAAQGEEPHMRTPFRCLLLAMRLLRSLARSLARSLIMRTPCGPPFSPCPPPSLFALSTCPLPRHVLLPLFARSSSLDRRDGAYLRTFGRQGCHASFRCAPPSPLY